MFSAVLLKAVFCAVRLKAVFYNLQCCVLSFEGSVLTVLSFRRQCSRSCGIGMQYRRPSCHRLNMLGWLDPEPAPAAHCSARRRPHTARKCHRSCSARHRWKAGSWSQVSGLCPSLPPSLFTFSRLSVCVSLLSSIHPFVLCPSLRLSVSLSFSPSLRLSVSLSLPPSLPSPSVRLSLSLSLPSSLP